MLLLVFGEFFEPLEPEEQESVWGIAFPPSQATTATDSKLFFEQAYDEWLEAMNKRLLKRLDFEKLGQNTQKRALLSYFPQQLQLFKHLIARFIQQSPASQIRGIYFASAQQGAEAHDF